MDDFEDVMEAEKLISTVQLYPLLWDRTEPDFSDTIKKENAWKAVLESVYGEEKVKKWTADKKNKLGKVIQKRWRFLRNCFNLEVDQKKQMGSGSKKPDKKFIYFDQMFFLLPSMIVSDYVRGLMEEGETEDNKEASEFAVPCRKVQRESEGNPGTSKKIKLDFAADDPGITSIQAGTSEEAPRRQTFQRKQEKTSLEDDPDELFLLSLLKDLKSVPDPNKASVKIALLKAIHDGQHKCANPPHQALYNTQFPSTSYSFPNPTVLSSLQSMFPNATILSHLASNISTSFEAPPPPTEILIGRPTTKQTRFSTVSTQTSEPSSHFRSPSKFKIPLPSQITPISVPKLASLSDSEDSTD